MRQITSVNSINTTISTEDEGGLGNFTDNEDHAPGIVNTVPATPSDARSPRHSSLADPSTVLKSPDGTSGDATGRATPADAEAVPVSCGVDARVDRLVPRWMLVCMFMLCAWTRLSLNEHQGAKESLLWAWILGPIAVVTLLVVHIGLLQLLVVRSRRISRKLYTRAVVAVLWLAWAGLVFLPHLLWSLSYVVKKLDLEEQAFHLPALVAERLPVLSPLPWPSGLLRLVGRTFFRQPYDLAQDILHRRWPRPLYSWREVLFCMFFWAAVANVLRLWRKLRYAAREIAPGSEVIIFQFLAVLGVAAMFAFGAALSDAALILYRLALWEAPMSLPRLLLSSAGFEIAFPAEEALVTAVLQFILAIKLRYQAQRARWAQHRRIQAMRRVQERISKALKKPFYARMAREAFKKIRTGVESVRHRRHHHRVKESLDGRAVEEKRQKLVERRRKEFEEETLCDLFRVLCRRDVIIEDSLNTIWSAPKEELLTECLEVHFEDEFGADHGGLQRDWFDALGHALVVAAEAGGGHFCVAPDKTLTLRPKKCPDWSVEVSELYALGRVLALAIWFGTPLAVPLSDVFCKMILGDPVGPEDLRRLAPEFFEYRVERVLRPGGASWVQEELRRAGSDPLCFMSAATSLQQEQELCEGGSQIQVTEENKHEYVMMLCEHFLCGGTREQIKVLLAGFSDLIPTEELREVGLTHRELALLFSGYDHLDVAQWKVSSSYTPCRCTEWFWEVVQNFSDEDRAKLLHFTTGASRLSLHGFEALRPKFTVTVQTLLDRKHLPHAHTCTNELVLPDYASKDELKERLQTALAHGVGFGFA